jgi:hypothetical protein
MHTFNLREARLKREIHADHFAWLTPMEIKSGRLSSGLAKSVMVH